MAKNNSFAQIAQSVMGFSYDYYFKACYFAGLYRRANISPLSEIS